MGRGRWKRLWEKIPGTHAKGICKSGNVQDGHVSLAALDTPDVIPM